LADFLSALEEVLGSDLVAVYLYGSAVTGGFDLHVSDIDLVVVTSPEIGAVDLAGLERMHDELVDRHPDWRGRVEVAYVGRSTMKSFRTSTGSLAVISPGEPFHVRTDRAAAWLQNWYLVRETGVCLYGLEAQTVIPTIAWTELVGAVVRYAHYVRDANRLEAGAGTFAYAILTMCRALFVVRTRGHGSKQEAAAWTRERMPPWAWLIDAALECRLSGGAVGFGTEALRDSAETFIALLDDDLGPSSP
jgi:predicted nucleotidyltransferase